MSILDVLGFDMKNIDPSMLSNFVRKDELAKLGD